MKYLIISVIALFGSSLAWDEDATIEDGLPTRGLKENYENDGIAGRILATLHRFERRLDRFENQFNRTVDDLKKTTTQAPALATTMYYGRYGAGRQWTPWQAPTTTQSPQEICANAGNFLCYNGDPVCVAKAKVCDGKNDCKDGSDEFFCKTLSPEELLPNTKCPEGYPLGSEVHGKCYWFSMEKPKNWIGAMLDCVKRDGKLAAIKTRLEQEAIARYLRKDEHLANATFWIGGTSVLRNATDSYLVNFLNANINKQWSWVPARVGDATETFFETGFSFWNDKQPDANMGNEFCLEIRGDFKWKWNDQNCNKEKTYICEVPLPKDNAVSSPTAAPTNEDDEEKL